MTSIRQLKSWLIKKLNRERIFVYQIVNVQLSVHYIFRSKTLWRTFPQSFSGIVGATWKFVCDILYLENVDVDSSPQSPRMAKSFRSSLSEEELLPRTMVSNRLESWKVHFGTVRTWFNFLGAMLPVKLYRLKIFETAPLLTCNLHPTSEKE